MTGRERRSRARWALVLALHLAAAVSLAAAVATAIGWARGGWEQRAFHRLVGRWEYLTAGDPARDVQVQIIIVHAWPTPAVGPPIRATGTPVDVWLAQWPEHRFEGGGFGVSWSVEVGGTATHWIADGRRLDVDAPFSRVILACLALPVTAWVLLPIRRRGIRSAGQPTMIDHGPAVAAADLPCVHCGYNLRAQSPDGRCPECGSPVRDSFTSTDLTDAPTPWLRRVAAGCSLLQLSRLFLAATFAAVFKRNGGFVGGYVPAVALAVTSLITHGTGVFLLTSRERRYAPPPSGRLRPVAFAGTLCLAAGVAYQVVGTLTAPRPLGLMGGVSVEWYWPALILLAGGWVVHSLGVLLEFRFLSRLARRMGDRVLARSCAAAGTAAAAGGLALTFGANAVVGQWEPLGIITKVVIAVWFAALFWTGMIHLDVAVRLVERMRPPQRHRARS
jgi:hypothetical protein